MSVDRRGKRRRSYKLPMFVLLIVVLGVVAYFIFSSSSTPSSPLIGTAASSQVLGDIASVSNTTLSTFNAAANVVNAPVATGAGSSQYLTSGGKPEVLYVGGEYCPYCATERWSMILALDRFGTFSGVEYMQSSSSDVYANTYTFTFVNATYTSKYITFVSVEEYDRNHNSLQTPTAAEDALMDKYDDNPSNPLAIPFVDFGNQYVILGSQATPTILRVGQSSSGAPLNWTTIASQLNNPSSTVAKSVDQAANDMIASICKIDGGQPAGVCTQNFAQVVSFVTHPGGEESQLLVSDATFEANPIRQTARS